jgi:hypothetical protein
MGRPRAIECPLSGQRCTDDRCRHRTCIQQLIEDDHEHWKAAERAERERLTEAEDIKKHD